MEDPSLVAPEKPPASEEAKAVEEPSKAEEKAEEAGVSAAGCETPSAAGPGVPPEQEAAPAEEAAAAPARRSR